MILILFVNKVIWKSWKLREAHLTSDILRGILVVPAIDGQSEAAVAFYIIGLDI